MKYGRTPMSYMVSHLVPYPKPKAPQSQITILLTYSFRLCVDCNVGAPRGIAHCILRKSRRSTHKLRLQGSQITIKIEDLDKVKSRLNGHGTRISSW